MAVQTKEEKIKKIDEKMAQLKAQKQALMAREKEKERKERTRRLIQIGALSEKYLHCEGIAPEDFENLIKDVSANLPAPVAQQKTAGTSASE